MIFNTKKRLTEKKRLSFKKVIRNCNLIVLVLFFISISSISLFHFFGNPGLRSKIYNKIDYYFFPLTSDFYSFDNLLNYIEGVFLKLTEDDIIYINSNFKNTTKFHRQLENTELRSSGNKFTFSKGKFIWNDKKVNIKFRPKGDREIHYRRDKPSYRVKVKSGITTMNGLKEFSLQDPVIRNYIPEYIWYKILEKYEIITPFYDFKKLYYNGEDKGIYSVEEVPTTFMIERLGKRNSSILKFDESFSSFISDNPEIKVINGTDIDLINQKISYDKLKNFIESEKMEGVFDLEKTALFFAISDVLQIRHGLYSKSMRFYLDPISGLLEPIPFDGHYFGSKFINRKIHLSSEVLDTVYLHYEKDWVSKFFNNKNLNFQKKYFEFLDQILEDDYFINHLGDDFFEDVNFKLKKIYYALPFEDRINFEGPFPYLFNPEDYILNNIKKIKAELEKQNIQFYLNKENKNISIISFANFRNPVTVKKIRTENYNIDIGKKFFFDNTPPIKSLSNIMLEDSVLSDVLKFKKLEVIFNNHLSKKVNLFEFEKLSHNVKKSIELIEIQEKNDTLYFKDETTIINKDITIPNDKKLLIKEGQSLILNNAIIEIHGDLFINGTLDNKVKISTSKLGGKIIQIGGKSEIYNCVFENFNKISKTNLNTSSLTFYKCDIKIFNSEFIKNQEEDFLNIVSSNADIEKISFNNCFSDCFDSDFSTGTLKNIKIINSGNDGADFSGSNFRISNLSASNISDKAVSVGENTELEIGELKIRKCEIGLVTKDGSEVLVDYIETDSVKIPLSSFIKKPRYNNPKLIVSDYCFLNFEVESLIQKGNIINLKGRNVFGDKDDVESYFYGNYYGEKTVR